MYRLLVFLFLFCFTITSISAEMVRSVPEQVKPDPGNYSIQRGLTVDPLTGPTTVDDLVTTLLGSNVSISNIQYTGAPIASGLFAGGLSAGIGIEEGVVLSCGYAANAIGPNLSSGTTGNNGLPGDPMLDNLIPGYSTNDATILEFDFVPQFNGISFTYVFGSEEYPEWVGSGFNDVFGFFLDGINVALIPDTNIPVAINNVNDHSYSQYYMNNHDPVQYNIECDGFTTILEVNAAVVPGHQYHIRMGIADAGDHILDSWVFLEAESFSSVVIEDEFNVFVEGGHVHYTNEEESIDILVTATGENNSEFYWFFPLTFLPSYGRAIFIEPRRITDSRIIRYIPAPNVSNTQEVFGFIVMDNLGNSVAYPLTIYIAPVNDPPVNTIPPTISGDPYVGCTLTCDPGEWNDDLDNDWVLPEEQSTIEISYQWQRQENRPDNWNDIEGETSSIYTLALPDLDLEVRCMVTAEDNGIGNWPESTSMATAPVFCLPAVENEEDIVITESLISVSPNPFNPQTTISYQISESGRIELSIYDIRGKLVKRLVNEERDAGEYSVIWQGRDECNDRCHSGIYFCRLQTAGSNLIEKLVLLK